MSTIGILVVVWCVVGVMVLFRVRRRHVHSLPEVSDEVFGAYCQSRFGMDPVNAVIERKEVSRLLGIPMEKLSPEMRLGQLVANPLDTATKVGLGDLEFDLSDLARRAGVSARITMPSTVAEVVKLRLDLKSARHG